MFTKETYSGIKLPIAALNSTCYPMPVFLRICSEEHRAIEDKERSQTIIRENDMPSLKEMHSKKTSMQQYRIRTRRQASLFNASIYKTTVKNNSFIVELQKAEKLNEALESAYFSRILKFRGESLNKISRYMRNTHQKQQTNKKCTPNKNNKTIDYSDSSFNCPPIYTKSAFKFRTPNKTAKSNDINSVASAKEQNKYYQIKDSLTNKIKEVEAEELVF